MNYHDSKHFEPFLKFLKTTNFKQTETVKNLNK